MIETKATKSMEERVRKKLAEMNLLDDFLFGSVVATLRSERDLSESC